MPHFSHCASLQEVASTAVAAEAEPRTHGRPAGQGRSNGNNSAASTFSAREGSRAQASELIFQESYCAFALQRLSLRRAFPACRQKRRALSRRESDPRFTGQYANQISRSWAK